MTGDQLLGHIERYKEKGIVQMLELYNSMQNNTLDSDPVKTCYT